MPLTRTATAADEGVADASVVALLADGDRGVEDADGVDKVLLAPLEAVLISAPDAGEAEVLDWDISVSADDGVAVAVLALVSVLAAVEEDGVVVAVAGCCDVRTPGSPYLAAHWARVKLSGQHHVVEATSAAQKYPSSHESTHKTVSRRSVKEAGEG